MAGGSYFASRCKAGRPCRPAAENSRRTPLPDRGLLWQIAAREGRRRAPLTGPGVPPHASPPPFRPDAEPREMPRSAFRSGCVATAHEPQDIGRGELIRQPGQHDVRAEPAQIDVEIASGRHEVAHLDAGVASARMESFRCQPAGRIAIARDIEPGQHRSEIKGGKMVRRQRGNHRQIGQHRFEREHGLDAFTGGEHVGGAAEAHAVAEEMAERTARIGEWGLLGTLAVEPGCDGRR